MQKEFRLTNNASFNYIYKNGEAVSSPLFTLLYVRAGSVRIGVSVGKKIGKATVRNLVKRRVKECFRALIPSISGKYNYVVAAREAAAGANSSELSAELQKALKRAGHLKNA
jgi:ribonuclease P protein component, eubacterial